MVFSVIIVVVTGNSGVRRLNIVSMVLTVVSCVSTVVLFVFFYRYAVKHLELSRSAKRRQRLVIITLSISALARSIVNFMLEQDALELRKFSLSCYDESWHYSMFIFFFQLIANILPVLVFLIVFNLGRQRNNSEVIQILNDNTAGSMLIE